MILFYSQYYALIYQLMIFRLGGFDYIKQFWGLDDIF